MCSLHFEENCIDIFGNRANLRKNAIPTIFSKKNERAIRNIVRKYKSRVFVLHILIPILSNFFNILIKRTLNLIFLILCNYLF